MTSFRDPDVRKDRVHLVVRNQIAGLKSYPIDVMNERLVAGNTEC